MSARTVISAIVISGVLASALAEPAGATLADSMTAELAANGVPNPLVTIATPPAATAADASAYLADPSQQGASLTPLNLLSPDPASPLPVVTVKYTPVGSPHPVASTGTSSTTPIYVEDSQRPVWDGAIVEALKHAIGAGNSLAGAATYGPPFPGRDTSAPDVYAPAPDPTEYSAANPPQTMTTGAVQVQYQLALPSQYGNATVAVADAAGGQRVVTIGFNQVAAAYETDNLSGLTDWADDLQAQLNDPLQGGNIGEVVVRSEDPTSHAPLFVHVADTSWGQRFEWSDPSVQAFTDPVQPDEGD
jgi:hypothetical protein